MKKSITKIVLFVTICFIIFSCSVTKDLKQGDLILRSNKIFVNDVEISTDSLSPLLAQKKKYIHNWFSFSWQTISILKNQ